jgi:3-oxoacyl-[acyl-carrier protein] reductase/2-hydroxycyclohexanecarboxyl-CoA dehydrogenase
LRLAAEGADVTVTDVDPGALTEATDSARAQGQVLRTLLLDSLGDPAHEALAAHIAGQGGVEILVANAGGSLHTPYRFLEESDADWRRVIDLNLMGAVWACRCVLPWMQKAGYGRIVNLGSKAGAYGSLIAGANYAASKGAIASLTRQLALEFGPSGVTVNCVQPGIVMTERVRGLWAQRRTEEERKRVLDEVPLRRHGEVADVAAAVAFLASDDASFITGACLDVNGGQAMS